MARLIGFDYEPGDRVVIATRDGTYVGGGEDHGISVHPMSYLKVGDTGTVTQDIDSDQEVKVEWDNHQMSFIHFSCLQPIGADVPRYGFQTPDQVEEFLAKE